MLKPGRPPLMGWAPRTSCCGTAGERVQKVLRSNRLTTICQRNARIGPPAGAVGVQNLRRLVQFERELIFERTKADWPRPGAARAVAHTK
jgi:hypothetical protein